METSWPEARVDRLERRIDERIDALERRYDSGIGALERQTSDRIFQIYSTIFWVEIIVLNCFIFAAIIVAAAHS